MKNWLDGFKLSELKWLTVHEAAQVANVSTHTIKYHLDKGHFYFRYAGQKCGRYIYLIEVDSLKKIYPEIVHNWHI